MKLAIALVLLALLAVMAVPSATLKATSRGDVQSDVKEHDQDNAQSHDGEAHEHENEANDETAEQEHEIEFESQVHLTGSQQVPSVTTHAFGKAEVELISNGTALKFELEVCDIANVTMAHIHVGASGTNGPIVLFLYGHDAPLFSATDGCEDLSSGTLTPSDLIARPDSGINNWDDFVKGLLAGNMYVNVHTTAHPGGEIRAQLTGESQGEDEDSSHGPE